MSVRWKAVEDIGDGGVVGVFLQRVPGLKIGAERDRRSHVGGGDPLADDEA